MAERARLGRRVPAGETVLAEGEPAEVLRRAAVGHHVDDPPGRAGRRRDGADRPASASTRARCRPIWTTASQQAYTASLRAVTDAAALRPARRATSRDAVRTWFPMAIHLLEGLFLGMRNSQQIVGQRQQLLALGALSAGLTHELNNPAAAAVRATAALRERVAGMRHKLAMLAHDELTAQAARAARRRAGGGRPGRSPPHPGSPRGGGRARGRASPTGWTSTASAAAWELAPIFVAGGHHDRVPGRHRHGRRPELLDGGLRWLAYTLETELLLDEITDSVTRISSLVAAAKQYSQHGPRALRARRHPRRPQEHAGHARQQARRHRGRQGLRPHAAAGPGLRRRAQPGVDQPHRQRRAGDGRHGTLTLRTRLDGDYVRVEIGDTGPGIPPRSGSASSSRSSPPSRSARAPGWAWTSRIASSSRGTAAT